MDTIIVLSFILLIAIVGFVYFGFIEKKPQKQE